MSPGAQGVQARQALRGGFQLAPSRSGRLPARELGSPKLQEPCLGIPRAERAEA